MAPILALCLLLQAPDARWQTYRPAKGGYSVRMPGKPAERVERAEGSKGRIDVDLLIYEGRTTVFAVYHHETPDLLPADREKFLDNLRDGTVGRKRGTLEAERALTLAGLPGREFTVEYPLGPGIAGTAMLKVRAFLADGRCYQAMAVAPTEGLDLPAIDAFLASFTLGGDPPAPAKPADRGWKTYYSPDGNYQARLPGTPVVTTRDVDTPAGKVPLTQAVANAEPLGYIITYVDYDEPSSKEVKNLLDQTRDLTIAASRGTKLLAERKVTTGRHPGRAFDVEVPIGEDPRAGVLRCRTYLVKRRLYQMIVVVPKADASAPDVEAFLNSFKLLTPR